MTIKDKEIAILNAAMKEFSENGFHNTAIQDIATSANVGKGTVYEYFKSKDEIFIRAYSQEMEKYISSLERVLGKESSFLIKLAELVEVLYVVRCKKSEKMKLLAQNSLGGLKEEYRQELKNLHVALCARSNVLFKQLLTLGAKEGLVDNRDLTTISSLLSNFIFVSVMISNVAADTSSGDAVEWKDGITELILYGVIKREKEVSGNE